MIYDANDNLIEVQRLCRDPECTDPYINIQDAFGRSIQIDFTGPRLTESTQDIITAAAPGGTVTWTVNWISILIGGSPIIGGDGRIYECGPLSIYCELAAGHRVVNQIVLPSTPQTSYLFAYSDNQEPSGAGYGELDDTRTPQGAQFVYRYLQEGLEKTLSTLLDNPVRAKTITHDAVTDLNWTYAFTNTTSQITNPDGGIVTNHFFNPDILTDWRRGLVWRVVGPRGSIRERVWAQNKAYGRHISSLGDPNNPFVQKEMVTVGNSAGVPTKTAISEFTYDKNGNLLSKVEYDWVNYPATAGVTRLGSTTLSYHYPAPPSTDSTDSQLGYWRPHNPAFWQPDSLSARRLDAVKRREVSDGAATQAVSEFEYDQAFTKGNPTVTRRWDSVRGAVTDPLTAANSLILTRAYDAHGNLTDVFAPEVRTRLTYGSAPEVSGPGPYPTQIDWAYQAPVQRSRSFTWDYTTGLLSEETDLDNSITTSYTYDQIGRRLSSTEAGLRTSSTSYDDAALKVSVQRDLRALGDGLLQTVTHYDQLGRVRLVRSSDGAALSTNMETDGIKVENRHLAGTGAARRQVVSTPYRTTADLTLQWTCTEYDQLDRAVATASYSGATAPADCRSATNRTGQTTTVYDADKTTVTDPAGKARDSFVDALGRLKTVVEVNPGGTPPNYTTTYSYDSLDNLRTVTQGSQPSRSFAYSSLSRLLSVLSPENGTISYTYYDHGNVETRSDDGFATTTFTYDALQRITGKSYSVGPATPAVTYAYYLAADGVPKVGRLKSVSSSVSTTTYDSYDLLGRVLSSTQTITGSGKPFAFSYTHFLHDGLASRTYPSGRVVSYTADDAGRETKVADATRTFVDLTAVVVAEQRYTATGLLAKMRLGNGLWETREYRTPQGPTRLKLGTTEGANDKQELEFNYSPTQYNGNVVSQVIRHSGQTWTQSYTYDGLNRLASAAETGGWSRTYGYDQQGNRWVASTSGLTYGEPLEPAAQSAIDAPTNRLAGLAYDGGGNLQQYNPHTLSYDAESRLVSAVSASGANLQLAYDGEGRRVKKVWTPAGGSAQTTYYVYDAGGILLAEYADPPPTAGAGTFYLFGDLLGSTRLVTDQSQAVATRYDYLPFGRLLSAGDGGRTVAMGYRDLGQGLDSQFPHKFTGKERDAETGLDYFGARYLSGAQGRFTSPDPFNPMIDFAAQSDDEDDLAEARIRFNDYIGNPQHWNRYTYGLNNPLKYVDRDGQIPVLAIAAAAYGLYELGSTAYDAYTAYRTLRDPRATAAERSIVTGGFLLGAVGPGGGYGTAGRALFRSSLELGQQINTISLRVGNILSKNLDAPTIQAAMRELKGEVVAASPRTGKPFDHVRKVREAATGLRNEADKIKKLLRSTDLTQKARAALQAQLRRAKRTLEELESLGLL